MARVPCIGGPADGLTVAKSTPMRWIDPVTGRGYRRKAEGRALYRLERRNNVYRYSYIENNVCPGCGAVIDRHHPVQEDTCPLCGHERG